jgi:hypothetical protein
MIDKRGNAFLTPNAATLYTNMEGTRILPNDETQSIMNSINGHAAGTITTEQLGNKLDNIERALRERHPDRLSIEDGAWMKINNKHGRTKKRMAKYRS